MLGGARLENIIKPPELGAHLSTRLLAPGRRTPPWRPPHQTPPTAASHLRKTCCARADPKDPRGGPSLSRAPPPQGDQARAHGLSGAASARPGNGEAVGGPQPYVPATLPGSQIGSQPHLPVHGRDKHGALETARAGVGGSLECSSKSVCNNSLAFEDSRHLENHSFTLLRAESQRGGPLYACAVHFM